MQSTSNAVADDKAAGKTTAAKVSEKIAEKRRALGRGLESLLPRVVPVPSEGGRAGMPVAPLQTGTGETPVAPSGGAGVVAELQAATATPGDGDGAAMLVELQAAASGRAKDGEPVYQIPLDRIRDNPNQTRMSFDKEHMTELAASIAVQGVLQPIVVRPAVEGKYFLILGERRLRASRMAGKVSIPAIIKRVSEQQAAEMTITENLQRQDLDCIEQAGAFAMLSLRFHLTQEEIGTRVGVARETVSNYLRLLKLPTDVIQAIQRKQLSYSHARQLLRMTDEAQISKVAELAIEKAMSVQQLEDEIERVTMPGGAPVPEAPHPSGGARWVDPNVRAAQRSLEMVLGMRVRIRDRKGKGKIVIEYGTLEDFDRVVTMLKGK